ncbi:helix-turn-helix domain-containing protein [Castellaniella sp.]|uniref:helix-turn-helix domain-containing protein n=1 Tax=Castellaniella sp. TaxID=1955812 RepID=UPI002AFE4882|nr:helix-turn-helix domain-containing protein [Castellaniella sp.]
MNYFQHAPLFQLYGEQAEWPMAEMLHCETIASRSRLHNWHIRPHRHAGLYQILYLHRGRAIVSLDQDRPAIEGPAAVEVPQAYVHGFEFDADCTGHVITITNTLLAQLAQRLGPTAAPPSHPVLHRFLSGEHGAGLHEACAHLNAQYAARQPFREAQIEAWLTLLYTRLRSRSGDGAPRQQTDRGLQHYARFGELLEQAHSRQHAVAWYARQLGLSTTHLNLIARTHAGKTPLQLIHERLALEASRSLIYTSMTISEISDALGFSEPAHFTRFFRQAAGQSPRGFRQDIQRRANPNAHQDAATEPSKCSPLGCASAAQERT